MPAPSQPSQASSFPPPIMTFVGPDTTSQIKAINWSGVEVARSSSESQIDIHAGGFTIIFGARKIQHDPAEYAAQV